MDFLEPQQFPFRSLIMILIILAITVFLLAYFNGANDNFKGVATLYGSNTTTFRTALIYTTVATVLGSIVSITFAATLAKTFSGKGLIPPDLAGTTHLLLAVAVAGATTIWLATRLGMPTSTTHALTGALVGAGLVNNVSTVDFHVLLTVFARPLLISPLISIVGAAVLYAIFTRLRKYLGVNRETCLCIGECAPQPVQITNGVAVLKSTQNPINPGSEPLASVATAAVATASAVATSTSIQITNTDDCREIYTGQVVGINAQSTVNAVHFASAGAVSFARAVNDTPKIAALLLTTGVFAGPGWGLAIVALAMMLGGIFNSRRTAETISRHITTLNSGQGLTANLVTAGLVLVASKFGVPVSTTHVSIGAIFGIGLVNKKREWKTIAKIAATWLTTLPLGMALGAATFYLLRAI